jgi:hypothetical protein
VFTVEQRDALRERVLRLGEDDERVVAGAVVGSLAVDGGDRFSNVDLTFGIADHVQVADYVLTGPESLSQAEQVIEIGDVLGRRIRFEELSPEEFRRETAGSWPHPVVDMRSPRVRRTAADGPDPEPPVAGNLFISRRRSLGTSSGGASSTRCTRARYIGAGASESRPSITSAPCAITRSQLPVSARGDRRASARLAT